MTDSARHQAFSIPEIFEQILLKLDPRTLLTKAQLICRAWTTFIQTSPAIQWALFFKPKNQHSPKSQNPLLAAIFPSIFNRDRERANLTLTTFQILTSRKWDQSDEIRLDAWVRPEASWRRMLIQQPPLYTLSLLRSSAGHGGELLHHYKALVSFSNIEFLLFLLRYFIVFHLTSVRVVRDYYPTVSVWRLYLKFSSSEKCGNSSILIK